MPFNTSKLAPNFLPKKKYVVHLRNLQFYLAQGAVLTKIHRIISFHQEAWIAPYIALNTSLRQQAVDDFEKSYYKLLNNSFFGKTIENIRKRVKIVLVNSERGHAWQTSKPGFKRFTQFSPDLVGVELVQSVLTFDKPIYVGFSVLELSKLLMYQFHYNVIKRFFPNSVLCGTDTDSLIYHIKTTDLYKDLSEISDYFDFSNYKSNHPLYNNSNKSIIGKFKDETGGIPPKEYIGLRTKMYSMLVPGGDLKQTASGIKDSVKKRLLHHELYKQTLIGPSFIQSSERFEDVYINQKSFRSYNHTIKTVNVRKIGLTRYDDKRYICEDNVTTRPYGHYRNSL